MKCLPVVRFIRVLFLILLLGGVVIWSAFAENKDVDQGKAYQITAPTLPKSDESHQKNASALKITQNEKSDTKTEKDDSKEMFKWIGIVTSLIAGIWAFVKFFFPSLQRSYLGKKHQGKYQTMLRNELGYIRMLGLPGVESVKIDLNDDTFVPLRFSERPVPELGNTGIQGNSQRVDHAWNPEKVMQRAFRQRRMLLVIGDPGSGKTTLLKYYALCALDSVRAGRLGFDGKTSVFYLPLREVLIDKMLPENLSLWAKKNHKAIDMQFFDDWLNRDTALVLLDGLDEISDTSERKKVCSWIDNALHGFEKSRFVVTSRETGYRKSEGVELASDYEQANVLDFTPDQQKQFLSKWFEAAFLRESSDDVAGKKEWAVMQKQKASDRTTAIIQHLSEEKNKSLRQLAAIPMILQIMAILWKEQDYMPATRTKLYDAALDYLLELRDKRRKIEPAFKDPKAQISAFGARKVLAPVAFWMQDELKNDQVEKTVMLEKVQERLDNLDNPPAADEFCDYLVKRAGLLMTHGDKVYLFRHKTFREYLAGIQLKDDRPYDNINKLISHFGEDWWEEPLRFFISYVDAGVFDLFIKKLFDSLNDDELQKHKALLLTLIDEATEKKVDALCEKLMDRANTPLRQRVILDCLNAICKPASIEHIEHFRDEHGAKNRDVEERIDEVLILLNKKKSGDSGLSPIAVDSAILFDERRLSFRNPVEGSAQYILISGNGNDVSDLYFAKYPVTNRLYRRFIDYLQSKDSEYNALFPVSGFMEALQGIAKNQTWDTGFAEYLGKGKNDLAGLFRSKYDEDRKFGGDDQPVVSITWYAARSYCLWLSLVESKGKNPDLYRLPTEPEWEWAASGKEKREYPWGNSEPTPKLANYSDSNIGATTPVGSYPEGATPEGLYDMAGNVWEWQENRFGHEKYPDARALRGGSWDDDSENLRCSSRNVDLPDFWYFSVGFRVVRPSLAVEP